jgi:hypothetical protein
MTRNQKLTDAISKYFDNPSPLPQDQKTPQFEYSTMDMYQIKKVHKTHIELSQLFNEEVFLPVYVDSSIHPYLKKNDTFLMTLGLNNANWHVIYMSPPYFDGNV